MSKQYGVLVEVVGMCPCTSKLQQVVTASSKEEAELFAIEKVRATHGSLGYNAFVALEVVEL